MRYIERARVRRVDCGKELRALWAWGAVSFLWSKDMECLVRCRVCLGGRQFFVTLGSNTDEVTRVCQLDAMFYVTNAAVHME